MKIYRSPIKNCENLKKSIGQREGNRRATGGPQGDSEQQPAAGKHLQNTRKTKQNLQGNRMAYSFLTIWLKTLVKHMGNRRATGGPRTDRQTGDFLRKSTSLKKIHLIFVRASNRNETISRFWVMLANPQPPIHMCIHTCGCVPFVSAVQNIEGDAPRQNTAMGRPRALPSCGRWPHGGFAAMGSLPP